jgi:hypothetical protein
VAAPEPPGPELPLTPPFGTGDGRRRLGDLSQVASARHVRLVDGPEDGVRAVDVRVAGGVHALVVTDRGMDVGPAWFGGYPLNWQSPTGIVHPSYFQDHQWLRNFHGGLLVTAGLQNVGPPSGADDNYQGLHGRVSNLPASNVTAIADEDEAGIYVDVAGQVRETSVYGADLQLTRRLRFRVGHPTIEINDVVSNVGYEPAPLMILYHFNVGHPVVDDGSRLYGPERVTIGFDEQARDAVQVHDHFGPPVHGAPAQVFEHRLEGPGADWATFGVINEAFQPTGGMRVSITYRPSQLPRMWQWRMLAPGMYLVGIEPANCGIRGRDVELASGTVDVVAPGDTRRFDLVVEAAHGVSLPLEP